MVENANRNQERTVLLTISFTVTARDKILDRSPLKWGTWRLGNHYGYRQPILLLGSHLSPISETALGFLPLGEKGGLMIDVKCHVQCGLSTITNPCGHRQVDEGITTKEEKLYREWQLMWARQRKIWRKQLQLRHELNNKCERCSEHTWAHTDSLTGSKDKHTFLKGNSTILHSVFHILITLTSVAGIEKASYRLPCSFAPELLLTLLHTETWPWDQDSDAEQLSTINPLPGTSSLQSSATGYLSARANWAGMWQWNQEEAVGRSKGWDA